MEKKVKKILLVDDEPNIIEMYKIILETNNYEVYNADNGKDGFNLALEKEPDFILSDIVMSKADGFYLLSKIKDNKKTKDIPVLMLTNLNNPDDKAEAKKMGACGYLVKVSYTPLQLLRKINENASTIVSGGDFFIE